MANSGTIYTNDDGSKFYVSWNLVSQNVEGNYSTIQWECGLYNDQRRYTNTVSMSAVYINDTCVYSGGMYSNFSAGWHSLSSGTMTIWHWSDGTRTIKISDFTGWLYAQHNYSASGDIWWLPSIPRQATVISGHNITDYGDFTLELTYKNSGGLKVLPYMNVYTSNGGTRIFSYQWSASTTSGGSVKRNLKLPQNELDKLHNTVERNKEYYVTEGVDTYSGDTYLGYNSLGYSYKLMDEPYVSSVSNATPKIGDENITVTFSSTALSNTELRQDVIYNKKVYSTTIYGSVSGTKSKNINLDWGLLDTWSKTCGIKGTNTVKLYLYNTVKGTRTREYSISVSAGSNFSDFNFSTTQIPRFSANTSASDYRKFGVTGTVYDDNSWNVYSTKTTTEKFFSDNQTSTTCEIPNTKLTSPGIYKLSINSYYKQYQTSSHSVDVEVLDQYPPSGYTELTGTTVSSEKHYLTKNKDVLTVNVTDNTLHLDLQGFNVQKLIIKASGTSEIHIQNDSLYNSTIDELYIDSYGDNCKIFFESCNNTSNRKIIVKKSTGADLKNISLLTPCEIYNIDNFASDGFTKVTGVQTLEYNVTNFPVISTSKSDVDLSTSKITIRPNVKIKSEKTVIQTASEKIPDINNCLLVTDEPYELLKSDDNKIVIHEFNIKRNAIITDEDLNKIAGYVNQIINQRQSIYSVYSGDQSNWLSIYTDESKESLEAHPENLRVGCIYYIKDNTEKEVELTGKDMSQYTFKYGTGDGEIPNCCKVYEIVSVGSLEKYQYYLDEVDNGPGIVRFRKLTNPTITYKIAKPYRFYNGKLYELTQNTGIINVEQESIIAPQAITYLNEIKYGDKDYEHYDENRDDIVKELLKQNSILQGMKKDYSDEEKQTKETSETGCGASCMGFCYTGCFTGCTSTCGNGCMGCGGSCGNSCDGTCGGTCSGNCNKTCDGSCRQQCSEKCGTDCKSDCKFDCTGGCYTTCDVGCREDCDGTCKFSCWGSCQSGCDDSCGSGCSVGCGTGCTGSCGKSCYGCTGCGGCSGDCGSSCGNSCSGQCKGGCQGGCASNCTYSCGMECSRQCAIACSSDCKLYCTNSCRLKCVVTCGALCTIQCKDTCKGTCKTTCVGGCSGSCGGSCNLSCGTTCQTACGSTCVTHCKSSCSTGCTSSCGGCSGGCQGCSSSCSGCTGCSSGCQSGCKTSCNTYCGSDCKKGCSGTCSGSCTSGCTGSCKGGCQTGCEGSCVGNCAGGCNTKCLGVCSGNCEGNCVVSCSLNCHKECGNSCGQTCTTSCVALCTVDCSGMCQGSCTGEVNSKTMRCFHINY